MNDGRERLAAATLLRKSGERKEETGHGPLWQVLQAAYHQAALGKGKERHGGDTPFIEQPIMAIQRMLEGSPVDGHLFQVMKKAQEAGRMAKRGDGDAAARELYGAIVYAAAAAMVLGERPRGAPQAIVNECPWHAGPVASEDGSTPLSAAKKRAAIERAGERLRAGEFKGEEGDD